MKKTLAIVLCAVLVLAVIGTGLGIHFGYSKKYDETKTYTVETNGGPLRVAVISDLQLPDTDDKTTHQYASFEQTLTMLKNKGMDALIIGGDFTDIGSKKAWKTFKEIYDNVMRKDERPIPLYILGNHDYWLSNFVECWEIPTPATMQKRFTKYTGELPYSHKIINGYHFICWSSSNGSYDKCNTNTQWVRDELDKAVADDPNKPIFVITHLNPMNTVYGSDEWGNKDIADVLKDYSQVISISGHSHYSIIDERSIWQSSFTAFTTQSLDYIELEPGKFNGSVPKDAYGDSIADDVPACLYMEIEKDKVTVNRLEANTGAALKEPWILSAPFGKKKSLTVYSDKRADSNLLPVMPDIKEAYIKDIVDAEDKMHKSISFAAASDDDFVHSYRICFKDESDKYIRFDETDYSGAPVLYNQNGDIVSEDGTASPITDLLYFSDFVVGLDHMAGTVELRLPANYPQDAKYVEITAIDSWGAESESVLCVLR